MSEPLVSVVIPCFNGAHVLTDAVQSVVEQKVSCEIILVDDGSTDDSMERVRALQTQVPCDLIAVRQTNRGQARARNAGMRLARGKYVCFLDVDDCHLPGFLATTLQVLEKEPAVIAAVCQLEYVNSHRSVEPFQQDAMDNTSPCNLLLRTEAVRSMGGFPENPAFRGKCGGEDGAFRSELGRHGKIVKIAKRLYGYRVRPGNHFDLFLDRSYLDDQGRMRFRWLSEEESDGTLQNAVAEYQEIVRRRHQGRIVELLSTTVRTGHDAYRLYDRFKTTTGFLHPSVGFALFHLARRWPALGTTLTIGGLNGRAACWLAAGCEEGSHGKVVTLVQTASADPTDAEIVYSESTLAGFRDDLEQQRLTDWVTVRAGADADCSHDWKEPIRLLLMTGDPAAEGMRREFEIWSKFVVAYGLAVVLDESVAPSSNSPSKDANPIEGWQELFAVRNLRVLQRSGEVSTTGKAGPEQLDLEESARQLRRQIQTDPTPDNLFKLGQVLERLKASNDAIATYERLVELHPDHADGLNCLGILYARQRRYDDAISSFQAVIRLQPRRAGAHHNLGVACADQDRPAKAIGHFENAIRIDPGHAEAHKGKGMALLKIGQFLEGWNEYEWRLRCADQAPIETTAPLWDGMTLYGKTILLHSEQGNGDILQFVRFAPLVKARGGFVIVAAPPHLFPILRTCSGIDQLVPRHQPFPPHDVHAPLLTVPQIVGTELSSIPTNVPYLQADPDRVSAWRRELSTLKAFKIGVVWQGNPDYANDFNRSFPLTLLQPIAEVEGVHLISLQVGHGNEQRRELGDLFPLLDLSSRIERSFVETAAVMKCLDLVICCDTASAHLAGALGVPVWVALPHSADWRWLQRRHDSPWYPTMRLFRQAKAGEWPEVFRRIAEGLAAHVRETPLRFEPADSLDASTDSVAEAMAPSEASSQTSPTAGSRPPAESKPRNPALVVTTAMRQQFHLAERHFRERNPALGEQVLQKLVADLPDSAEARYQLGLAQQSLNKLPEAFDNFRHVVRTCPDHAEAHTNLGIVLCRLGKKKEGEASIRRAIHLKPDHAVAHNNLGVVLAETGRHREALAAWMETVRLAPNYAEAHFNIGVGMAEANRYDEAIRAYETTLRLRPDHAEAYSNLGMLHIEQSRPAEAVVLLQHAVRLKPDFVDGHNQLGLAFADLGRGDEALDAYREALRLKPGSPEVYNNLGTALAGMGRPDEALSCFAHCLRVKPNYPEAHWHQALTWLQKGDMERGWPEYEWRWKRRRARARRMEQPLWDGSSLEGKTILLWCEQGMGDNLQFVRYASHVKARGGTVLLEATDKLAAILGSCSGVDRVVPEGEELPEFDVHAPLLSLPGVFQTRPHNVPAAVPYLHADPDKVAQWRLTIEQGREGVPAAHAGKLKVGIVWQGNPLHRWDRHRSIDLRHFTDLARRPGVQLYSLQKGANPDHVAAFSRTFGLIDLGAHCSDWTDTAAAFHGLDLLISCDSAPAHLAAAMGIPVWVALAAMSDWRWLIGRADSPWYPTMRLFRQKSLGDWDAVFERIGRELDGLATARASDGDANGATKGTANGAVAEACR